ncbi:contractile injection system tape measure protein [Mucilaginibacter sp. cycad4]|uniref:contractile injection system tape measure protein n=1 Tax=Mucilaginibacter sp. cycad4 TaxID=3342096 RepID=UPI002AAA76F9|nr:contractile injection system tape measure protein [Mucilaginibacter gossypii]WPV02856.1 contractile injection system tape measure protein [Mucilaginibacter gossypii]
MAGSIHIIHKVILDIEVSQRGTAQKVQDEAVRYFEQVLLKKLEQLLDDMDVPAHVLIDKIDLDLGSGKLEDVLEQLEASLYKTLEPVIYPVILPVGNEPDNEITYSLLTEEQQAFSVFAHFLNTGRLPWYTGAATVWVRDESAWLSHLIALLINNGTYSTRLTGLLKSSPLALSRLFNQFGIIFIKKLAAILLKIEIQTLQKAIDTIVVELRRIIIAELANDAEVLNIKNSGEAISARGFDSDAIEKLLLMLCLSTGRVEPVNNNDSVILRKLTDLIIGELKASASLSNNLIQIVEKAIKSIESSSPPQKNKPIATPDHVAETSVEKQEDTGGIYVNQAGLVILHPFLEYFFKDFGLLQDNDFVDLPARQLAVHLLHYLGTGNINAFEYDLYFEKFLCRWPLDEPLAREVEIPQRMLDEGDNMLRTVIKYWKALKNTSPGGLRDAFLIRNGKLIEAEQPARLIVERMDLDILLSSLPWGIGVIKLLWMDEPFYVEWQ